MIAEGVPDLVVVGNVAGSKNPEWMYVQKNKIPFKSYPEVIKEYLIKPNSIVCAGTFGKSTSTVLLTWILKETGFDPSYMFGALSLNDLPAAALTDSDWSVVEGDEYKASRWDAGPKFNYYSPTHLLLTSVVWDHADVYPTEKEYRAAFQKLVALVPADGLRVISEKAEPFVISTSQEKSLSQSPTGQRSLAAARDDKARGLVTYGKTAGNDYAYNNVVLTAAGVNFDILYKKAVFHIASSTLGEYMADNITGCFALAHQLGIAPEKIIATIKSFAGVKRRLEKRFENGVTIYDDIAHSPPKAQAVLSSLRQIYLGKLYAIFEPNTGNRELSSLPGYAHAFIAADEVIIPRLTKIKTNHHETNQPVEGDVLARAIAETHPNVVYIDDDEALLTHIKQKIQPGDVVVFLGSHGFRGMIEELVSRISNKQNKQ